MMQPEGFEQVKKLWTIFKLPILTGLPMVLEKKLEK